MKLLLVIQANILPEDTFFYLTYIPFPFWSLIKEYLFMAKKWSQIPANMSGFKIFVFFLLNLIFARYLSPMEVVTNAKLYFRDNQLSEKTEIHSSLIL